ncbi:MAG: hypothetical protein ACHQ01_00730 [Candidatus Limnocylindrales bacterium]
MDSHDDRTEARVRAAFASELRRAESDLDLSPLKAGQRPEDRSPAAGVAQHGRRSALRTGALTVTAVLILGLAVGAGFLVAGPRNAASSETPSTNAPASEIPPPSAAVPLPTSSILRYGDGIPQVWQGQPVLRWTDALARRSTATDDTPFLAGGWLDIPVGASSCPASHADPSAPPTTWISNGGCQFNYVSTDAGSQPTTQNGVTTFRFYKGNLTSGPAIMRVHIHDPRATQCGYQEAICDDMIVVDDVVWTGDAATAPHPLSVAQVIAAATVVSPTSGLRAPAPDVWGCGASVTDGLMLCPPLTPATPYTSPIAGAAVLPSSDALARALPGATPGVVGALQPSAVAWSSGTGGDYRRLVVDNVVVFVRTSLGGPDQSDRAFLTQLVAALKAQEAAGAAIR